MAGRAFRAPIRILWLCFSSILLYYCLRSFFTSKGQHTAAPDSASRQHLVVASLRSDNTTWLVEHLPEWHTNIYVADDPEARLTVPLNKGREAMVYLTYIIDNYRNLPDYVIFIHGLRYQWHNDDPIYGTFTEPDQKMACQSSAVFAFRYAPLRCTWVPGCPAEMQPLSPTERGLPVRVASERAYASAFKALLPKVPVPSEVGATCSAQFAATRERITRHRKSDYERMRRWLIETELDDEVSGRIMEYSWHNMSFRHTPKFRMVGLKGVEERTDGQFPAGTSESIPHGAGIVSDSFAHTPGSTRIGWFARSANQQRGDAFGIWRFFPVHGIGGIAPDSI
ncbi:conserved hypothetical protein [Uncinocarpus reesii 1704]|uniref:Uncharacterized protein n=1 Tax=Uncinocarpus reesii (strain UAMH 1704) TaxID=336963 RepID=C4JVC8_UNCRE|nr:uncharacterized protein UREG_06520 [Uncinocarpus reesii 1704]EEP81655.1 conserved hypothetical protein [Uncinocarpus reesii 1704]